MGLPSCAATRSVALFLPLIYAGADSFWMLIPAFVIQGIISAGWDMGLINVGIQLAKPDQIPEYAAVQSTIVGVRGMVVPHIGIGLIGLGIPMNGVFVLSTILMALSVWLLGRVQVISPQEPEFSARRNLRYRWPMRFRIRVFSFDPYSGDRSLLSYAPFENRQDYSQN